MRIILRLAVAAAALSPLAAQVSQPGPTPAATGETVDSQLSELLDLLFVSQDDLAATNLRLRPGYVKVAELIRAGKKREAVEAFGEYYNEKLGNPAKFGINPLNLDPRFPGVSGFGRWPSAVFDVQPAAGIKAAADALMKGRLGNGEKAIELGEPGSVNWLTPFKSLTEMKTGETPNLALASGMAFTPLVRQYLLTRDVAYLNRWKAYMADWVAHADYVNGLHPLMVPSGVNSNVGGSALAMLKILAALAQAPTPDGKPAIEPELLARILRKVYVEEILPSLTYIRSNNHNWTPGVSRLLMSMILDEFKASPSLFRDALRRQVEDNAVTQNLRDGTENQQDPWYNENYLGVVSAITLMQERGELVPWGENYWILPVRGNYAWRREIRDHLREHVTYLLHLRTAQNEWPIPFRGGDKRAASRPSADASVEAYDDPVNQAILASVDAPDAGLRPPYNSEWFPYAGFNILRENWEKMGAYGAMFSAPHPGAYGAYRSQSNNNIFGLAAFGQDLLVDDTTGHYMYPSSPILVDDKNQFYHDGLYKVGNPSSHKTYQVSAWTDPAPWRWHDSANFGLMEGIYHGAYGNPPKPIEPKVGAYGKEEASLGAPDKNDMIRDVTHQRLVLFDRATSLWIIVDRLSAPAEHKFKQVWMIPLTPAAAPAFQDAEIQADAAQKMIRTNAENFQPTGKDKTPVQAKANFTMRQFTGAKVAYSRKATAGRTLADGRILTYGWDSLNAEWRGSGPQQIVSAILPRAPGSGAEADFQAVKELTGKDGVGGFSATLPGGKVVELLSAPAGTAELSLGPVSVHGELLLLSGKRGIVLGAKDMTVNGKGVVLPGEDFEFETAGGKLAQTTPIYRPIAPVQIGPDFNVFTDAQEVVMSSATPGMEIRYTLDGSDPTPLSPLYAGPVKITQTTTVKARAYRPGLKENPPQTSGTQATPVSLAVFTKRGFLEPPNGTAKTAPGLKAEYFEDDWKKLWLELDARKPVATADGVKLWDLSIVPASNPPVGEAPAPRQKFYTVRYSGFIEVPRDGVYTFHAPREVVFPDVDPGYELRLEVGDRAVPFGGRTMNYGLNEWYPSTRLHAQGNWSIALKKGRYPFRVTFLDYRTDAGRQLNRPGIKDYIWSGVTPEIKVSGPGLPEQPIPAEWLSHKAS